MNYETVKTLAHFDTAIPNAALALKQLKDDQIKVVGTYCVYAPQEIIIAAGAVPVSLCATKEEPIADGKKYCPGISVRLLNPPMVLPLPTNVRSFIFLMWLLARQPVTERKRCSSLWRNLSLYM